MTRSPSLFAKSTAYVLTTAAAVLLALVSPRQAFAQAAPAASATARPEVRNILLIHGAFADGSGWRAVYDDLVARGYRVSVVQTPLTSLPADVAAVRRVLDRQDGPAILVGHSYGGVVITEAGEDPRVAGLVYVAAFAPDRGQSALDQYVLVPPPPGFQPEESADGFNFLKPDTFREAFAADLAAADIDFLRDSQAPVSTEALSADVAHQAWSTRRSWYVVAMEDGAIAADLQRQTARKIGAITTEVSGSHVVFISQPAVVANVIASAAREALTRAPGL